MRSLHERKQRTIDFVCKALEKIEGGKLNAAKYRKRWEAMTDEEFEQFMVDVRANQDKRQIAYLEVAEFERDLKLDNIEKCADFMGVPLYEYVAIPDATGNKDNVVVTPQRVPVGYAHYKRMPQTVLKKNSLKINVSKRNPLTGQLTSDAKTARNTDVETYAFTAMGAKYALRELMGPRADDPVMEAEMMQAIANTGSVSIEQCHSDPKNKIALNTLNTYFLMQMFATNLIGPLGILPRPDEERSSELRNSQA